MSAIEQYCEAIPAPGGDRGSADSDRGGGAIPAATRRALAQAGADGQAVLALSAHPHAKSSSRTASTGASGRASEAGGATPAHKRSERSGNVVGALTSSITGTDTTGSLFGLALFALTLVLVGAAWVRYRSRVPDA